MKSFLNKIKIQIRPEKPGDYASIYAINTAAFETPAEANLVDRLRSEAHPVISLVAEAEGEILGHILFSPVTLTGHPDLKIMGLGPMAVKPERQKNGVGSALVSAGLERCKDFGYRAVVVLGHTWFYPRFGFQPSTRFDICSEYDVPEEAFMVLELQQGYLSGASGMIKYHPAFTQV